MANPYRGIANARRVNNSDYMIFGKGADAYNFEDAAREAGYTNVRVSRFRVGSSQRRDYNFKVTVYWKDGEAAPNMEAFVSAKEVA